MKSIKNKGPQVKSSCCIEFQSSSETWLGLADNITIHEDGTAVVKFKSGMEVTVGIK